MTEVDRDIALALLKRLWQRGYISEEIYVSACHSRFFDSDRFSPYAGSPSQEDGRYDDCQKTS